MVFSSSLAGFAALKLFPTLLRLQYHLKIVGCPLPNDHQRQMHYGPRAIIPPKWIWINHPIDLDIQMVRESSRIDLKREKQHLVEYMAVSSPTKCIACSLDTYRGALYPISFFTFSCVFAFIWTLKDTWSETEHESTSNEKISLASNICPFQAQQSALCAPLIPTEAPCILSSSLFLASSPSNHAPKHLSAKGIFRSPFPLFIFLWHIPKN